MRSPLATISIVFLAQLISTAAHADPNASAFPLHAAVRGSEVNLVEIAGVKEKSFTTIAWGDLSNTKLAPGTYSVRFAVAGGDHVALEIPPCAGRSHILLDGVEAKSANAGPMILQLPPRPEQAYEVVIEVSVGGYEHRVACGFSPRFGAQTQTREGLSQISFSSPAAASGGGRAVVFIPPGHDWTKPGRAARWSSSVERHAVDVRELFGAAARGDRTRRDFADAQRSWKFFVCCKRRRRGAARRRCARAARAGRCAARFTLGRVDGRSRCHDDRFSQSGSLRDGHELLR